MYFLSKDGLRAADADALYIKHIDEQPDGNTIAVMAVSNKNEYMMETFKSEDDAKIELIAALTAVGAGQRIHQFR